MDAHQLIDHLRNIGEADRKALAGFLRGETVSGDINQDFSERLTFGQRMADRMAAIGGSWTFVIAFLVVLAVWMTFNSEGPDVFDPYPFILLNLALSCLAALQAPIIMMSQNRQSAKDRLTAQNDYEVNLKAELEIAAMASKIDQLLEANWAELLEIQRRQVELLERLEKRPKS